MDSLPRPTLKHPPWSTSTHEPTVRFSTTSPHLQPERSFSNSFNLHGPCALLSLLRKAWSRPLHAGSGLISPPPDRQTATSPPSPLARLDGHQRKRHAHDTPCLRRRDSPGLLVVASGLALVEKRHGPATSRDRTTSPSSTRKLAVMPYVLLTCTTCSNRKLNESNTSPHRSPPLDLPPVLDSLFRNMALVVPRV